jgi:hypothetical protein
MLPAPAPVLTSLHVYLTPAFYVFVTVSSLTVATRITRGHFEQEYLLGSIGVYGLALYHQYVGRSHPFNWYHIAIPLVVLLVVCAFRLSRWWTPKPPWKRLRATGRRLAWVLLAAYLGLAAGISYLALGRPGVVTRWDMLRAGFQTVSAGTEDRAAVEDTVSRIQELVPASEPVAILSEGDAVYYVLAGRRSFSRFVPLYSAATSYTQATEAVKALTAGDLHYVFAEKCPGRKIFQVYPASCRDLPVQLYAEVSAHYALVGKVQDMEIWRRK